MKTRKELICEYERLLKVSDCDYGERSAVVNALQWVIWGNGEPPSEWIEMKTPKRKSGQPAV